MGTITVYRGRSMFAGARRAMVVVDGEPVGAIWRGQRTSVEVPDGDHRIEVRIGSARSRPLTVESGEAEVILAIRLALPADRGQQLSREDYLQLVPVADYDDPGGVTFREMHRNRPAVGYRRLRGWERPVYAVALVVGVASQLLRHTLGDGLSLAIGAPALLLLLVLFFRLFLYRADE